jgi:hypothetical protein
MSHSVPPDSSLLDRSFLAGPELVRFAPPTLPIHAVRPSLWAQAGSDAPLHGLSVDRLYGDTPDLHVESTPLIEEPREIAAAHDDPVVVLPGLSDGILLPACEQQTGFQPPHGAHTPGAEAVYDFFGDHVHLQPQDAWPADLGRTDWFYDHHV